MNSDLSALLVLQEKYEVVLDIKDELDRLKPEFAELDDEVTRAENELEARRTRATEAEQRRQELETKIEGYRMMQERKRQKLEWVRGAKEASTLMAELDLARSVLAREEADWMRSADRVQEMETLVAEAEKALEELRVGQAPRREELEGRKAALEEKMAEASGERDKAAKSVKPALQDQFQRILRGRARLALYPLKNGACGHCFTSVPLHRQQKIRNGDTIEACEACGVLVYQEAAAVTEASD